MDQIKRREFLSFLTKSSIVTTVGGSVAFNLGCSNLLKNENKKLFENLSPTQKDEVVLAPGLSFDIVVKWKDQLNSRGAFFGYNNDYLAIVPRANGMASHEQLMWANHESVNPIFVSGFKGGVKTSDQVEIERKNVGGSFFKVQKTGDSSTWKMVQSDQHNLRVDGLTKIPFSPPQKIKSSTWALGTLANCAGGVTPWGTVLTCEENYQDVYGETIYKQGKEVHEKSDKGDLSWEHIDSRPPEHYGWVVEVEPSGKAKKLISLGRFAHEGATPVVSKKSGRLVVYMGDDANNQFVYKFVSKDSRSLDEGQLFVADTVKGRWLELNYEIQEVLKKNFSSQQEVLIRCREAAKLLGATPQNRPEDIEIDPVSGAIFVALTNNKKKGDYHGKILRIEEEAGDYSSLTFKSDSFFIGGKDTKLSCPDNLLFDRNGNLWVTTDISGKSIGKKEYSSFGNNGLFFIPLKGEFAGQAFQVASAPNDAEFTGPCFSEDQKSLFLSVQHPGELTRDLSKPTSTWPDKKNSPKPAVICITGPLLDQLLA